MTVDIVSATLFAFLVVLGWRSGALRQILRIVAIIAVVVGVPFFSPFIRQVIFDQPGRATPGIEVASILIAGLAIYVSVALAGWVVVKLMRLVSSTLDVLDRMAGATIGAVKAVVLVYLFAVLVVMMEGPIAAWDPEDDMALRDGHLTQFVADYNVLAPWQFPDLARFHTALRVGEKAETGDHYELIREDGDAAEFLRDERIEELLEDEQLMQWMRDEHYPMTLADERVRQILNDAALMDRLDAVDWTRLEGRIDQAEVERNR